MSTAELLIHSGKLQGRKLTLPAGEIVVGRDEGCQIRMASSDISRQHCVLRVTPEGIAVKDLESRNGTFVNDVAVQGELMLKPGDVLRVGPMVFQVPPAAEAPAPPPASASPAASPESERSPDSERRPEPAGAKGGEAGKAAPRKPKKKATDDDIANWLTEGDSSDSVSPGDTTIIAGRAVRAAAEAKTVEEKPERKAFRNIQDEAADIIRRHHEAIRRRRDGE